MRIGDRVTTGEFVCKRCGTPRVEQLEGVEAEGGRTWVILPCSNCKKKET